ncbi:ABC transporter ATP-binding protein [Christensenellaceae bacterium OttesenSCG-928-K19]|nr:ABC transporter ATP-binding protein [Christensenellaceae bacterium OttesenSCG-928-K19]
MKELVAHGLRCGYHKHDVVKGIDFSLNPGEVLVVLGANGSGKTTLFKAIMRFLPLSAGHISVDGQDVLHMSLLEYSRIFSYIPQQHTPVFSYTVEETAMMGRASRVATFSTPGKEDKAAVKKALETLKITHLKDKYYTRISGGERKLALIARALCQQSKIIVMDEPSSDLDYANQQLMINTILSLKEYGYSIILSTHAPEYPFSVADKVLLLKNGQAVSYGAPGGALNRGTLSHAFGVPMDVFELDDQKGSTRKICLPL